MLFFTKYVIIDCGIKLTNGAVKETLVPCCTARAVFLNEMKEIKLIEIIDYKDIPQAQLGKIIKKLNKSSTSTLNFNMYIILASNNFGGASPLSSNHNLFLRASSH